MQMELLLLQKQLAVQTRTPRLSIRQSRGGISTRGENRRLNAA
jgi:hypothetical protein